MTEKRTFAGRSFRFVGLIHSERTETGEVLSHLPQARYRNAKNLPLNRYGTGPFCRFRVAGGWRQGGVYVLTVDGAPRYVGECRNLDQRWGVQGYGTISPRNCYKGGQETNCRINNLIYRATVACQDLALWFHAIDGDKGMLRGVEDALVRALEPEWNR